MEQLSRLRWIFIISLILGAISLSACSSNKGLGKYNIDQAMNGMPTDVKEQIGDFKFYFGESGSWGAKELGPVKTSLRTNAFSKNPQISCNRVFYSALLSLKKQAEQLGGNAVENIQSNWKENKESLRSEFVCDNGLWISGVALVGIAVKE
ncbi:excinuclease [Thiotrichales bacterium 19S9-12]|nr:excinuclease [Thiotrichales bacterium 19S9-11]MCF6811658.1 excinuclease [Thiotrichales bacterium 19S9-12]